MSAAALREVPHCCLGLFTLGRSVHQPWTHTIRPDPAVEAELEDVQQNTGAFSMFVFIIDDRYLRS